MIIPTLKADFALKTIGNLKKNRKGIRMKTITKIIIFCLIGVTLLGTLLNIGFFRELHDKTQSMAKQTLNRWLSTQSELDRLEGAIATFFDFKEHIQPEDTQVTEETETPMETDVSTQTGTESITEPSNEAETEPMTDAETEPMTDAETEPMTNAETEPMTDAETEATTEGITEATAETDTDALIEADTEAMADVDTEAVTEPEIETAADQPIETVEQETSDEAMETETVIDPITIYTVKVHDGIIGVFDGSGVLIETVNVAVITLPEADRTALYEGITVYGMEEVLKILEKIV